MMDKRTTITKGKLSTHRRSALIPDPILSPIEFIKIEFLPAGRRILGKRAEYGGVKPSALAWLVDFLQEDLDVLSKSPLELASRLAEVMRFSVDGGLSGTGEPAPLIGIKLVWPGWPERHSSLELAAAIQKRAKDILNRYLAEGVAYFDDLTITLIAWREPCCVAVEAESVESGFLYQMAALLRDLGTRIRACRRCNRQFLAGRSDKLFCSGSCQIQQYWIDHPEKRRLTARGNRKGRGNARRKASQ